MTLVTFQDLGQISYQKAWDYQTQLHQMLIDTKLANRNNPNPMPQKHYFLMCEHLPVYTLGRSGSLEHLLLDEKALETRNTAFFKINRGGDITFHGLGQIVGYPIFDLECFFTDVHRYVRYLEEAIILTLAEYNLQGIRVENYTGVWLDATKTQPKRKICAIGVHLSRWVTLHGFAFNINTDLSYFDYIVPCGITDKDKSVTSLAQELGYEVDIETVKSKLKRHFATLFNFEYS